MLVDCILPLPVRGTYTYNVPAHLTQKVKVGMRVNVPFGRKQYAALTVSVHSSSQDGEYGTDSANNYELRTINYKDILSVLDDRPMSLSLQLRLWQWVADYYMCSIGDVYKAAIPSGLKEKDGRTDYKPKTVSCVRLGKRYFNAMKLNMTIMSLKAAHKQQLALMRYVDLSMSSTALQRNDYTMLKEITRDELQKAASCSSTIVKALVDRGILELYDKQVSRLGGSLTHQSIFPKGEGVTAVKLPVLSEAQKRALDEILTCWRRKNVCLLHGVTGSGKTEIYIHLISEILRQGKQVLYLLPEIVLTSQLTDRLSRVFGDRLGVYHSRYSDAERVEVYQKQVSDRPYDIIVGVRSSVLLPFQRLGLVIVDEEHENSFKQAEPAPRYHARNVALVMAQMAGAKALLGTATPSLESYYNAQQGKYGLVKLTTRFQNVQMPQIEVVDLSELKRRKMMSGPFSPQLLAAMRGALEQRQQVILFQNRRGFAPQVSCHVCGWVPECPNCDVSLTYHKRLDRLVCHYCGYTTPVPKKCPQCDGDTLSSQGYGTERIEDILKKDLPQARLVRMDLDTTRSRQAYEDIIHGFQEGRYDILIGTQMVTKGLDFRRVGVVGILNASTMLCQPDFRSYEHAFQMMTQVAGRAGRNISPALNQSAGKVILQVYDPQSSTVQQVVRGDYDAMFMEQMEDRKLFNFPPVCHVIMAYLKHKDENKLMHLAQEMADMLRKVFGTRVAGPDTPAVARVQNLYIRRILLKIEPGLNLAEARKRLVEIQEFLTSKPEYKSAMVYYDVD